MGRHSPYKKRHKQLTSRFDYRYFPKATWGFLLDDIAARSYNYSVRHHGRKASLATPMIRSEIDQKYSQARKKGHVSGPKRSVIDKMARKAIMKGYRQYLKEKNQSARNKKFRLEEEKRQKDREKAEKKRLAAYDKKVELKRKREDAARKRKRKIRDTARERRRKERAARRAERDRKLDEKIAAYPLYEKILGDILGIGFGIFIIILGIKFIFHPIRSIANTVYGAERLWYELFYSGHYSLLTAAGIGLRDGILITFALLAILIIITSIRGEGDIFQRIWFNLRANIFTIVSIDIGCLFWVLFTIWNVNWFFKIVCLLLCIPIWFFIAAVNILFYSHSKNLLAGQTASDYESSQADNEDNSLDNMDPQAYNMSDHLNNKD